jgi:hypothetical protein
MLTYSVVVAATAAIVTEEEEEEHEASEVLTTIPLSDCLLPHFSRQAVNQREDLPPTQQVTTAAAPPTTTAPQGYQEGEHQVGVHFDPSDLNRSSYLYNYWFA